MPTGAHTLLTLLVALTAFPSERSSVSPDHRYRVTWTAPPEAGGLHSLSIIDLRTEAASRLFSFTRHVEVLWSPSGRHLALTDFRGSNESVVFVFTPSDPSVAIPVSLPADIAASVAPHGHRYVRAVRWASPIVLVLRVTAHDNSVIPPFEGQFKYIVR